MDITIERFEDLRMARTPILDVAYADLGPRDGTPVVLLHGYPYDVHSFAAVAPLLTSRGFRVIVPHLRGHGPTRFLRRSTPRSGQQAALGRDAVDLLDALHLPRAILAGFDSGGRAACVAAALHPERVLGLVTLNGYLIQDIARSATPIRPDLEAGFWYFYYFLTERGRAGLEADPRGIAEVIWRRNSPQWRFAQATLDAVAGSFANPDYVAVVIHSYRHRLGFAPGAAEYEADERVLASAPPIPVPAVTLDGLADGNFPATDGSHDAAHFTGPRVHHRVDGAGHNLPAEVPAAFAEAVLEVADLAGARHTAA